MLAWGLTQFSSVAEQPMGSVQKMFTGGFDVVDMRSLEGIPHGRFIDVEGVGLARRHFG